MTILFGDGKLKGDVEEDLFVLWGDVELNGRVKRECATIFGSINLAPRPNCWATRGSLVGSFVNPVRW